MDDFDILIRNIKIDNHGSQGEQRGAVLAIKLAEIDIFRDKYKEEPILLLDDVFSELDGDRVNNIIEYISKNVQCFITMTDISSISEKILNNARVYEVKSEQRIEEKVYE